MVDCDQGSADWDILSESELKRARLNPDILHSASSFVRSNSHCKWFSTRNTCPCVKFGLTMGPRFRTGNQKWTVCADKTEFEPKTFEGLQFVKKDRPHLRPSVRVKNLPWVKTMTRGMIQVTFGLKIISFRKFSLPVRFWKLWLIVTFPALTSPRSTVYLPIEQLTWIPPKRKTVRSCIWTKLQKNGNANF